MAASFSPILNIEDNPYYSERETMQDFPAYNIRRIVFSSVKAHQERNCFSPAHLN